MPISLLHCICQLYIPTLTCQHPYYTVHVSCIFKPWHANIPTTLYMSAVYSNLDMPTSLLHCICQLYIPTLTCQHPYFTVYVSWYPNLDMLISLLHCTCQLYIVTLTCQHPYYTVYVSCIFQPWHANIPTTLYMSVVYSNLDMPTSLLHCICHLYIPTLTCQHPYYTVYISCIFQPGHANIPTTLYMSVVYFNLDMPTSLLYMSVVYSNLDMPTFVDCKLMLCFIYWWYMYCYSRTFKVFTR